MGFRSLCQSLLVEIGALILYGKCRSGADENRKEDGKMELQNQIRKYRTAMNLSQEELAEKVYVSRQTVSNWETGGSLS